ncbi:Crp/Fnr family transcriptional regulator [Paraburkholderia aspalathi]|nr:Crp/Fnr family transcriptional regulator [Paraburkholderia aspalathi]
MSCFVDEAKALREFLETSPFHARLGEADIDILHSLPVAVKHYAANTIIVHQGDWAHNVHIINSGWGCVYRDLPNGDRQIMDVLLKGDFFGVRTGIGFNYNAFMSLTELSIFEISLDVLSMAVLRSSSLAMIIMALISRQRAILVEHLTNIGRRSAANRIAHFLLELGCRVKTNGMGTEKSYFCPLTQYELADTLGLTAIHVNRMLRELREQNLVSFRNNEVEFLNRPALMRMAGYDDQYLAMDILNNGDVSIRPF